MNEENNYEMVNHPSHYNRYSIEAVEMARRIWGDAAMKTAAEITAFFYRMRMGLKPENSVEQELEKEKFWLNYAKNLDAQRPTQEPTYVYEKRQILTD